MKQSTIRISNSGNIVCDVGSRGGSFGRQGAHVQVLAKQHPDISGEYINRFGANAESVRLAAHDLGVIIHYPTKKEPNRIFN